MNLIASSMPNGQRGDRQTATELAAAGPQIGAPGADLLAVASVRVRFRTPHGTITAVDGVNLFVPSATTVGVVGESGSGKSVLTRAILDLLPPTASVTADRIEFDGRDLRQLAPRQHRAILGKEIGVVLQDPFVALNPVVQVGRHFTETLRRHLGLSRRDAHDRAVDLLRRTGIPSPEDRFRSYPHELSGGMRQRACVALGMSCEPKLLIADEPTTALDVTTQRQILDLLGELRSDGGMSMILITHDLGIVAGRTDLVVVMYAGQVVEVAPTADLFETPRHRYTTALLASVPRIDADQGRRLVTIPGRPPAGDSGGPGCRFAPRCEHGRSICSRATPELSAPDATGRQHRCFFPADGSVGTTESSSLGPTSAVGGGQ